MLSKGITGQDGITFPLPGAFMPECKKHGSFEDIQCHGSVGDCWCVDKNGIEMVNTRGKDRNLNCSISMLF